MKKILLTLFLGTIVICSCQSDRKEVREKDQEVPEVRTPEVTAEDPRAPKLPYEISVDEKSGETKLVQSDSLSRLTPQLIIEAANIKYPEVRLILVKVKRPTAFVRIPDAGYLTQQMGSAGAESYLAEITYSLTSIKGITAVNFEFTEGDHASPGTYTRENFADLK
jgi:hypothetical protein